MINLQPNQTNFVWLTLKELVPVGVTPSYMLELTRSLTGQVATFSAVDLNTDNKLSKFNIYPGTPTQSVQNQIVIPASYVGSEGGWFQYRVIELNSNTQVELGRLKIDGGAVQWPTRPAQVKETKVYKRN